MEPFKADPIDWEVIESESELITEAATIRELRDRVAVLEAGAAPAAETPDTPQTLHTVALGMADTLERLPSPPLPEILDTPRRAIREPMVASDAPVPTDEKLFDLWDPLTPITVALRKAYDLGRQHAAAPATPIAEPAPLPPLEVGQRWRRRDAEVVEVVEHDADTGSWKASVWWYRSDHKYAREDKTQPHEYDLIELIEPAPAPVKLPQPDGIPLVKVTELEGNSNG